MVRPMRPPCHTALMVEPVIAPPRCGLEHTVFPEVRVRCVSEETIPESFGSEERAVALYT